MKKFVQLFLALMVAGALGCDVALASTSGEDNGWGDNEMAGGPDWQRPPQDLKALGQGDGPGFSTSQNIERLKLEVWSRGQRDFSQGYNLNGGVGQGLASVYRNSTSRASLVLVQVSLLGTSPVSTPQAIPPVVNGGEVPRRMFTVWFNAPGAATSTLATPGGGMTFLMDVPHYFILQPGDILDVSLFNPYYWLGGGLPPAGWMQERQGLEIRSLPLED
jgi:hypothetical protein